MFLVRTIAALALLSTFCDAGRMFFPSTDELFQAIMGNDHYQVADHPAGDVQGGGPPSTGVIEQKEQQPVTNSTIKEPSKCVWAILRCCIPGYMRVNIACFEEKGCHGNFFEQSPCRRESALMAHRIANRYYAMLEAQNGGSSSPTPDEGPEPTPHSPFDPIGPLQPRD